MMTENIQSKIRAGLTTEVKYIIFLAVFIFGVVAPYFQIRSDMAVMKTEMTNITKLLDTHIKQYDEDEKVKDLAIENLKMDVVRLNAYLGIKNSNTKLIESNQN